MYYFGRIFSAICGTSTVFITYLLGKEIFNKSIGLYSSIFLLLSIYHISHSSFASLDVSNAFSLSLFFYFIIKALKINSKKFFTLSSIFLGLSTGIKYSGFVAISFLLIYCLLICISKKNNLFILLDKKNFTKFIFNKLFIKYLLVFLITFLLTTPGILIYPVEFLKSISFELIRMGDLKNQSNIFEIKFYYSIFKAISISLGFSVLISFVFGSFLSFRKNYFSTSLLGFIIIYSLTVGSSFVPRYFVSIAPFLCIYAGFFINFIFEKAKKYSSLSIIVTLILFSLSISNIYSLFWQRYPDSRSIAKEWIKTNISTNESIGYGYTSIEEGSTDGPAGLSHLWRYPIDEFIYKNWEIKDFLKKPNYIILNSYNTSKVYSLFQENLVDIDNGFSVKSIPENKRYLIRRSFGSEYSSRIPEPEILEFYYGIKQNNLKGYKLEKEFKPKKNLFSVKIGYPSPNIKILKKLD